MTELLRLDTTELRLGDVVHFYGMRIQLDQPARIFPTDGRAGGLPCYSWVGLVLNPEEATAVPRAWLYHDGIGQRQEEPRWNVQGNEMAKWHVERPAGAGNESEKKK